MHIDWNKSLKQKILLDNKQRDATARESEREREKETPGEMDR